LQIEFDHFCVVVVTRNGSVLGNLDIVPASAEEIEKAIAAAQAKMSQAAVVLECCGSVFIVS